MSETQMRERGVEPLSPKAPDPKSDTFRHSVDLADHNPDATGTIQSAQVQECPQSTTRITTRRKNLPAIREFRLGRWKHIAGQAIPTIAALQRKDKRHCFIYCIERPDTGSVKIGFTWDVEQRLGLLQCSNDVELRVLFYFVSIEETEQLIHEMLAPWRIRGEWFRPSPEVLDWIKRQSREPNVLHALRRRAS